MSKKNIKCPFKPPRPPRELCRTFADWLLGIVSPSLCFAVDTDKTREYWRKVRAYKMNVLQWKYQKRTITKEEYKEYDRIKRTRRKK